MEPESYLAGDTGCREGFFKGQRSHGHRSDVLQLDVVPALRPTAGLRRRPRVVLRHLFHLGVLEDPRDQPLIKLLQVLRVLWPDEVFPLLNEPSDRIELQQLVVGHLWLYCVRMEFLSSSLR